MGYPSSMTAFCLVQPILAWFYVGKVTSENYFGNGFVPSSLTGGCLFSIMGCCAEPVDPVPLGKLLHCTVRIKMFGWPAGGGGGHFPVSPCAMAPPMDVNIKAIPAMLMIALIGSFISGPFLVFNEALPG